MKVIRNKSQNHLISKYLKLSPNMFWFYPPEMADKNGNHDLLSGQNTKRGKL